jgi:hypothetical protein
MKKYVALFACLWSPMALSFTLNSTSSSAFKGWSNADIKFQLNTSNCPAGIDVAGVINASLAIWNNVATSRVHLSVVGTTTSTTYSSPITIYCETNYGSVVGNADGSPGAASAIPASGDYFTSGVIILNASSGAANITRVNATLLSVVLAHEIGHAIGIGHSQDVNALMYYNASYKTALGLSQDDVDAISYLYPRNELGQDKPMGCGLIRALNLPPSGSQPINQAPPAAILLLVLAPLILALKLRKMALMAQS